MLSWLLILKIAFMLKCLLFCSACWFIVFGAQHVQAQDSSTFKTMDTIPVREIESLDKKTMDSIDRELGALFGVRGSHFRAGIDYLSNNVYFGRKDTVNTPYLTASLGYYHKSGLFINSSASYLTSSGENRIDLFTIEAGYVFSAGHFQGLLTASKFFYNSESSVVDADLKGSFSFLGAYDLGPFKLVATPELIFSNRTDFASTLGVEHSFYALRHNLDITPTFNASGSTQNYYNSYYRDRKFGPRLRKITNSGTLFTISGEVVDASQFKILDYEFSIPVNYVFKRFTFTITPSYIIPVHPAVVKLTTQVLNLPPKTRTGKEKLDNSFYCQAGVSYRF
jgi:hypothetical protein